MSYLWGVPLSLQGPVERARLRCRRGPASVAAVAALAALASLAGCAGREVAEIALVRGGVARRPVTLDSAAPASRNDLRLLRAALAYASAAGEARPALEGERHFGAHGGDHILVTFFLGNPGARETWRVDATWATRELPGGAILVWHGDLSPVTEAIRFVMPEWHGEGGAWRGRPRRARREPGR